MSQTDDAADPKTGRRADGAPRYSRRLSDKILIAFHQACDQGDFEVAKQLIQLLEMMLTRRPPDGKKTAPASCGDRLPVRTGGDQAASLILKQAQQFHCRIGIAHGNERRFAVHRFREKF